LVYLQYISTKIHSKCASQPKIAKNSRKTHILGVQGRSRSSMLVPPESPSAVLVMICGKSVSICNRSRAILVDSSRNRTFSRGYRNLMHLYRGVLEPRGSKVALLKSMFNAENFIAGCLGLSPVIRRSSLLKCVWQPQIAKNSLKTHILGVQGRSRSSMLVPWKAHQQCLL